MNLTASKLAHSIHVPTSRIQDILHNRRKITADTSIRLGRFFGVSDRYFLDMQNDVEIRELLEKLDGDITILTYTTKETGEDEVYQDFKPIGKAINLSLEKAYMRQEEFVRLIKKVAIPLQKN